VMMNNRSYRVTGILIPKCHTARLVYMAIVDL